MKKFRKLLAVLLAVLMLSGSAVLFTSAATDDTAAPVAEATAAEGTPCCLCGEVHNTQTVSGFFTSYWHDIQFVVKMLTYGFAMYVFS